MSDFRYQLERISREWISLGLPGREQVMTRARELILWRRRHGDPGLWSSAPRMITATLDDGIGQGIEIINLFADAMGIEVIPLGLMQSPQAVLKACHQLAPPYLGLTVLQPDTEEDLAQIGLNLPPQTRLVAGGPAFRYDPKMALHCGVAFVAFHVGHFIDFALKDSPFAANQAELNSDKGPAKSMRP